MATEFFEMENSDISVEAIWQDFGQRLRQYIRARVSDEHAVDDLLQETFIRIHKNVEHLADRQRLNAWVFRIVRNMVTDYYRVNRHTASPIADAPPIEASIDSKNLNNEVSRWLPRLIGQLPEPFREAIQLYEIDGLSQKDIAKRLQLSLPGAKSRIQRGRQKLKVALTACCSFELDRRGNVIDYKESDCRKADLCCE